MIIMMVRGGWVQWFLFVTSRGTRHILQFSSYLHPWFQDDSRRGGRLVNLPLTGSLQVEFYQDEWDTGCEWVRITKDEYKGGTSAFGKENEFLSQLYQLVKYTSLTRWSATCFFLFLIQPKQWSFFHPKSFFLPSFFDGSALICNYRLNALNANISCYC